MTEWSFLGTHAVTRYPSNPHCEYVVVKSHVVGYAELNDDSTWTYYHFQPTEKGQTMPAPAVAKATSSTAEGAVEKGLE